MRHFRLSLLSIFIGGSLLNTAAHAAAFQLYELGTPVIGTAGVGQAANTSDASTAYFNPAGMALLPSTEFMLAPQLMLPYANFQKHSYNTISGDNGGNAETLTPGMNMYFVQNYSSRLKFGASLTSPYGGALNYENGWVGRFVVQQVTFYTVNFNPSVAYQVNNWLALGAGASLEYMNLQQTTALPFTPLVDGQINVKVDNFAPGFNLGIMLTPKPSTKIGIAYRSQINHNLHGDLTFLRIGATPNTSTRMVMPQNVIASLSQILSPQVTLLAELGWSNWASMQNTTLHVDGYSATTPRNWNNTYRFGLGGQYQATPGLTLQAGASYDSSPTDAAHRLPDIPMDKQYRIGAGVIYTLKKSVNLGVSYEYWNMGNASINNTSSNGVLAGYYPRNYVNTVQASLNVEI